MYKFDSLSDYAVRAHVRLEGAANRFWTLHLRDGGKAEFYSIEGSPQRESDDARVYDYDDRLAVFLDRLEMLEPPGVRDDEDEQSIEYDIHFQLSYIDGVQLQMPESDDLVLQPSTDFIWRYDGRYLTSPREHVHNSAYGFTRRDDHCIKEVKLEGGKLVIEGTGDSGNDPAGVLHELHIRFRSVIMDFLIEFNKSLLKPIEDWNKYEGGVDDWWGMGSVSMFELGMVFTMQWREFDFTLTVE